MTNHEGVEIEAGDWIVAGKDNDADFGKVVDVDEERGNFMVAWEVGACQTAHSTDDKTLEIYARRTDAHDDYLRRKGFSAAGKTVG